MRGRSTCPTGQKKNAVEATSGSSLFSTRKGLVQGRPLIRPSVRTGAPSPRGEGFGGWVRPFPTTTPASPSPPSWGAGRYGRKIQGRRPGRKKRGPPQGPPNQSRESRGEKLSPLALFPPVSREKRGPPPGRRPTGRCAPRLRKSPDHPKGTQSRPGVPGPHQTAPSFFAQFCATFLPPPCTPACNFGPGSPGGERRFCHAHPP